MPPMLPFDESTLLRRLEALTPLDRVVFAASCSTRINPAYTLVRNPLPHMDAHKLAAILSEIWEDIRESTLSITDIEQLINISTSLIPGEDDEWIEDLSYAQDA